MTGRQVKAFGGLLVFVLGTLIVPAMHGLAVSSAGEAAATGCHSCCAHSHADHYNAPDEPHESRPDKAPHDPDTCSICQMAKMAADTAVVAILTPTLEWVAMALLVVPEQPDYSTTRLLPFSCGPPA